MKQMDYDNALSELKEKKNAPIRELRKVQQELKEEADNLGRTTHEMLARMKKLKSQARAIGIRIMEMEGDASREIRRFKDENQTSERKLSEVSDWALINELKARGYYGTIEHDERDAEWMQNFQSKFLKGTPPSLEDVEPQCA